MRNSAPVCHWQRSSSTAARVQADKQSAVPHSPFWSDAQELLAQFVVAPSEHQDSFTGQNSSAYGIGPQATDGPQTTDFTFSVTTSTNTASRMCLQAQQAQQHQVVQEQPTRMAAPARASSEPLAHSTGWVAVFTATWTAHELLERLAGSGTGLWPYRVSLTQDSLSTLEDYGCAQVMTHCAATADMLGFCDMEVLSSMVSSASRRLFQRQGPGQAWQLVGMSSGDDQDLEPLDPIKVLPRTPSLPLPASVLHLPPVWHWAYAAAAACTLAQEIAPAPPAPATPTSPQSPTVAWEVLEALMDRTEEEEQEEEEARESHPDNFLETLDLDLDMIWPAAQEGPTKSFIDHRRSLIRLLIESVPKVFGAAGSVATQKQWLPALAAL